MTDKLSACGSADRQALPIDLHAHTNKSDGSLTPTELVEYALSKKLAALAITDHDTTEGIPEALATANASALAAVNASALGTADASPESSIEIIPGIEFSSENEGKDIHILGLYIDYENEFFKERLVAFQNGRIERNKEMCKRLQNAGIDISYEKLTETYPDSVITRAHYAKYMYAHNYVSSISEAFDRYIGDRCPCFVPRRKMTPTRAIDIITKAGGVPILAHPYQYGMGKQRLEQLIAELAQVGLAGVEAIYCTHTASEEQWLKEIAVKYNLCISGGSDYHGSAKPKLELGTGYGSLHIPIDILDCIKIEHEKRAASPQLYHKKKILFTDLDGTLLDSKKQISTYTKEVLQKWVDSGHRLVLSSGRDINSVSEVQKELGLYYPGMFLAGYNGGQIYDCDKKETIYRIGLHLEQVSSIMKIAAKHNIYCQTYSDTHIISPYECEALTYYQRFIHTPVIVSNDVVSALTDAPCKCIAIELHDKERIEAFRKEVEEELKDTVTLLYSNEYYLEIFPANSGKGTCVKKLCEILDIPIALSVAAGDAPNDLSMLQTAGMAIAMSNGDDCIKDVSNIITKQDNNHDGLAHVLETLL